MSNNRYIRTQLECVEIGDYTAGFFVAGRAADEVVRVPLFEIPDNVKKLLCVGKILHAKAQVGVYRGQRVLFDAWEEE